MNSIQADAESPIEGVRVMQVILFLAAGVVWTTAARLWPLSGATDEPPAVHATAGHENADQDGQRH